MIFLIINDVYTPCFISIQYTFLYAYEVIQTLTQAIPLRTITAVSGKKVLHCAPYFLAVLLV